MTPSIRLAGDRALAVELGNAISPAGSVGIASAQTEGYPIDSPGGWRLIGRTPLKLYDPARENPFLLDAGDRVRFVPVVDKT